MQRPELKRQKKGIKVMRAQHGRWWGKDLGWPGVPTLFFSIHWVCVVGAALGCVPTGMPISSLCVPRETQKPMDRVGLAVPTAIPSDFPMCFACPPRLAVAFTASGHTGMSSGRGLGVATSSRYLVLPGHAGLAGPQNYILL